jgi:hypothetical protein
MKYIVLAGWILLVLWFALNIIINCVPLDYAKRLDEWTGK